MRLGRGVGQDFFDRRELRADQRNTLAHKNGNSWIRKLTMTKLIGEGLQFHRN